LTLSKYQNPDLSSFLIQVCFRVPLDYHAGLVVQSDKSERILELLNNYVDRLVTDYTVVVPQDKKTTCSNSSNLNRVTLKVRIHEKISLLLFALHLFQIVVQPRTFLNKQTVGGDFKERAGDVKYHLDVKVNQKTTP
jgi:hypothetical protein